jgi:hypothetical protein
MIMKLLTLFYSVSFFTLVVFPTQGQEVSDVNIPNEAQLSLPIANEKLVIAHNMTSFLPRSHNQFDLAEASPVGRYSNLGGLELIRPYPAFFESQLAGKTVDLIKSGQLDDVIEREMRSALSLGIDGFHFFYPCGADRIIYNNIIIRFFKVADERKIPFKITLCISSPHQRGTSEERAKDLAKWIREVIAESGHSSKWLKTPDGRILLYTFAPESLSQDINEGSDVFTSNKPIRDIVGEIGRAYRLLEREIGEPIAVIYNIRSSYAAANASEKAKSKKAYAFNDYQDYVNAVLDQFPAVTGFSDVPGENDKGWNYAIEACQKRNRSYVQAVFNEYSMSKVFSSGRIKGDELHHMKDSELERPMIGSRQSETFRTLWQRAVSNHAVQVNSITWNDYQEGHHMAPEANHNFGFAELLQYYKNQWRGEKPEVKDTALVFYKKHPSTVKGSVFNIAPKYPTWILTQKEWQESIKADDQIEVLTILKEPADLYFRDQKIGNVAAGLVSTRIPMTAGKVSVQLKRHNESLINFISPEWITEHPYRTDRMLYVWESNHSDWWKKIYGDQPEIHFSEYSPDEKGEPMWKTLYPSLVKE